MKRQGIFNDRGVTHFFWCESSHYLSFLTYIRNTKTFFSYQKQKLCNVYKGLSSHGQRLSKTAKSKPLVLSLSNPQVLSEEELCYPISHTGNTNPSHRPITASPHPWLEQGQGHGSFCPLCTKTSNLCELPHPRSPAFVLPMLLALCTV